MSNYTILLIDYEPRSIERVRRPLEAAGYVVEVATDGLAGIEAFQRIQPCLVLVEAMIPKKHGFEVCQELKKSPTGKKTPVIITTAVYKGRKYRNQAVHLYGCDDYLEKPVADDHLLAVVGRFVGAPGNASAQAVAAPHAPARAVDPEDEITARLDALLPGVSRVPISGSDEDDDVVVLDEDDQTPRTASAEVISFESHLARRKSVAPSGSRRGAAVAEAVLPEVAPEPVVPTPALQTAAPEPVPVLRPWAEPPSSPPLDSRVRWMVGAVIVVTVLAWLLSAVL